MSKKLLTEAEFRQFSKLANINSDLAEKRAQAVYTEDEPAEEETVEEAAVEEDEQADAIDELDMGAPPMEDEDADPVGDMPPEDDMGMDDMDMEPEAGPAEPVSLTDEQADAIVDLAGQIQATRGTEEMPEDEVDLDAELGGAGEEEMPPPVDDEEMAAGMSGLYENETEIIDAVVKRVAERLGKEQKIDDIASQLAERILSRLD
jgi:hypothetical protein